eukprot:5169950-Pyramimonas_sp.AAC.1
MGNSGALPVGEGAPRSGGERPPRTRRLVEVSNQKYLERRSIRCSGRHRARPSLPLVTQRSEPA